MTSQSVMSVDGKEIPGKAVEDDAWVSSWKQEERKWMKDDMVTYSKCQRQRMRTTWTLPLQFFVRECILTRKRTRKNKLSKTCSVVKSLRPLTLYIPHLVYPHPCISLTLHIPHPVYPSLCISLILYIPQRIQTIFNYAMLIRSVCQPAAKFIGLNLEILDEMN